MRSAEMVTVPGNGLPGWLQWVDTDIARGVTTLVAMVALVGCLLLGFQQQAYVKCIAEEQAKSAERSRILGAATDAERAADRALIEGPTITGRTVDELRAQAVAAREVTDRARAANPPPPARRC